MITYVMVAIAVLFLSIIVILMAMKNKKHGRRQRSIAIAYDRMIREHKLAVDYSEFLCCRFIGLDRRNRKLVIIDHSGTNKQEVCISLPEIGESRIVRVNNGTKGIKSIFLELKNKRNNKLAQFCFYNQQHDDVNELTSLSRKSIHWKTKVDIYKYPGNVYLETEYVL